MCPAQDLVQTIHSVSLALSTNCQRYTINAVLKQFERDSSSFHRKFLGQLDCKMPTFFRPDEPTRCASQHCNRIAFGSHRFCCQQCKHSNGIVHGHRCGDRQRQPMEPEAAPTSTTEDLQVKYLKALLEVCLPDLSIEDRKRWLRDMLRSFHSDRYSSLSGHHVCSQLLIHHLESQ